MIKLKFKIILVKDMDIYSSKFAIMVIIVLVAILTLQFMSNDNTNTLIDSETCELYVTDSQINAKKYLNKFDIKCMDFKNLNP